MIPNDRIIEVLNYEGMAILPSSVTPEGIVMEMGTYDNPVIEPISFRDIKIANSKTDFFKVGRLRFNKQEEDEIYKELHILDKENIMSEKEIRDFLQVTEKETFERIIKIKSLTLITRMKKVLFELGMANIDVSPRVVSCLNKRYEELKFRPNSSSEININDYITKKEEVEIKNDEELKAQKEMFENMMQKMKEELESQFTSQMEEVKNENEKLKKELENKKPAEKKTKAKIKTEK
ncbi:hypothetical protein [Clostridium botulinum]|uniref:hypothetical protein n=2 Tax=Clostridium botulinum TaxID=1491 RepID=UPI0007738D20|nr:hypothetical protein [Clostridium botulinum]